MIYTEGTIEAQLDSRKLFLIGEFDDDMLMNLCLLQARGIKKGSQLWLHSPGGNLTTLKGISDLISMEKNLKEVVGFGMVYSAAAYLFLMLPNWVEKKLTANTEMMFHQMIMPSYAEYQFEHRKNYIEFEKDSKKLEEQFRNAIDKSKDKKRLIERFSANDDIYFSAQEALELGIVDGVINAVSTW